jgi:hypothetical protein
MRTLNGSVPAESGLTGTEAMECYEPVTPPVDAGFKLLLSSESLPMGRSRVLADVRVAVCALDQHETT